MVQSKIMRLKEGGYLTGRLTIYNGYMLLRAWCLSYGPMDLQPRQEMHLLALHDSC